MITQSIDTHPAAEEVQLQLLRQATPAKRFGIMCSLSQTMAAQSRRDPSCKSYLQSAGTKFNIHLHLLWGSVGKAGTHIFGREAQ